MRSIPLALTLFALLSLAAAPAGRPHALAPLETSHAVRVESYRVEPVGWLNARIATGERSGESWSKDPLLIALNLASQTGPEAVENRHYLDVSLQGTDHSDSAVVVIVVESPASGATSGTWSRYRFGRGHEGSWRLIGLDRAWKCGKGAAPRAYSKAPCP